jgi:hypothetical protein
MGLSKKKNKKYFFIIYAIGIFALISIMARLLSLQFEGKPWLV